MRSGVLVALLDLAADVHAGTCGRSSRRPRRPRRRRPRATIAVAVLLAAGVDRDVAQRVLVVERDQVDGADRAAGLADRGGDPAEHAGAVRDPHAQDERVLRGCGGHGGSVTQSAARRSASALRLASRCSRFSSSRSRRRSSTFTIRTEERKEPSRPWASRSLAAAARRRARRGRTRGSRRRRRRRGSRRRRRRPGRRGRRRARGRPRSLAPRGLTIALTSRTGVAARRTQAVKIGSPGLTPCACSQQTEDHFMVSPSSRRLGLSASSTASWPPTRSIAATRRACARAERLGEVAGAAAAAAAAGAGGSASAAAAACARLAGSAARRPAWPRPRRRARASACGGAAGAGCSAARPPRPRARPARCGAAR